jgi:hypothetical protein
MPYTHFQYIAYQVPTALYDNTINEVVSGFPPGLECDRIERVRVLATPGDARTRLRRLAAVVDMAASKVQDCGTNSSTLKVFLAPEFYFRPPVPNEYYKHNTYPREDALAIFTAIDSMFAHKDFTDWLIVGGTVLWNNGSLSDLPANPRVYMNTAVYVQGGKDNGLKFVEKRLASTIDGVPVAMTPAYTNDPNVRSIHSDWDVRKQHIFSVGNVGFGLEVCLDHLVCTVKNIRSEYYFSKHAVNLHVLSAGGMTIESNAVAADINGYILRNDGVPNDIKGQIELMKVTGYTNNQGQQQSAFSKFARESQLQRVAHQEVIPIPVGNMQVPKTNIDPNEFQQSLIFYPVEPLI